MTGTTQRAALSRLRGGVLATATEMAKRGLCWGSAGNVSALGRIDGRSVVAITPSGVRYEHLTESAICVVERGGEPLVGELVPSSELPLHLRVYSARPDVGAVVHTHSRYATTFAVCAQPVRAVHYRLARAGIEVPVASYARYGSDRLARSCTDAMGEGKAVLLRNHGVVAVGTTLDDALETASAVEETAELQWRASLLGQPRVLSPEEMAEVLEAYASYGQPAGSAPEHSADDVDEDWQDCQPTDGG